MCAVWSSLVSWLLTLHWGFRTWNTETQAFEAGTFPSGPSQWPDELAVLKRYISYWRTGKRLVYKLGVAWELRNNTAVGCGDSSVGKVLVLKTWRPDFPRICLKQQPPSQQQQQNLWYKYTSFRLWRSRSRLIFEANSQDSCSRERSCLKTICVSSAEGYPRLTSDFHIDMDAYVDTTSIKSNKTK